MEKPYQAFNGVVQMTSPKSADEIAKGGAKNLVHQHLNRRPCLEECIAKALTEFADQQSNLALEEAAKVCDDLADYLPDGVPAQKQSRNCAKTIRALKSKPREEEKE